MVNISDASSVNQREGQGQDLTEEQNRIGIFLSKHGESEEKCKEILLRDLVGLFQEQFFCRSEGLY